MSFPLPRESTPEERLENPLKWDPEDPTGESLERLETMLKIAVKGNLISSRDSERILKILKLNPHQRISRLGQRLSVIETLLKDSSSVEERLTSCLERTRRELEKMEELCSRQWEKREEEG